jgi:hypothetical protein
MGFPSNKYSRYEDLTALRRAENTSGNNVFAASFYLKRKNREQQGMGPRLNELRPQFFAANAEPPRTCVEMEKPMPCS